MTKIFLSTYDYGISRAEKRNGQSEVKRYLEDRKVRSLAQHPHSSASIFIDLLDYPSQFINQ